MQSYKCCSWLQSEIVSFYLQSAFCPQSWISYSSEQKCFKYVANTQSWDEAEIHCQNYNGHLAAVTSFQDFSFLQKQCGENANGCWVGGRGTNFTKGVGWKWSDNSSYWNETISSRLFLNSSCPDLSCRNSYLDLCTLVTNGTSLVAQKCNMSHAFLCMIDAGKHFTENPLKAALDISHKW